MNTLPRWAATSLLALGALSLGACSNMSTRDKYTAGGAAVGGVAGNVISGGGTLGTVGGAVVGGVIGNQVGKGHGRDAATVAGEGYAVPLPPRSWAVPDYHRSAGSTFIISSSGDVGSG